MLTRVFTCSVIVWCTLLGSSWNFSTFRFDVVVFGPSACSLFGLLGLFLFASLCSA
jgi:hypothetical protein